MDVFASSLARDFEYTHGAHFFFAGVFLATILFLITPLKLRSFSFVRKGVYETFHHLGSILLNITEKNNPHHRFVDPKVGILLITMNPVTSHVKLLFRSRIGNDIRWYNWQP